MPTEIPTGTPREIPGGPPDSFDELIKKADELKQRIEEEKRKTNMPINSSLGDPAIDASNADGHNDLPPDDDEN